MTHPTLLSLASLLTAAAKGATLKKAVLSKPNDPTVLRTVLTLRRVRGEVMLQAERFTSDNKALHENLPANDPSLLLPLL